MDSAYICCQVDVEELAYLSDLGNCAYCQWVSKPGVVEILWGAIVGDFAYLSDEKH